MLVRHIRGIKKTILRKVDIDPCLDSREYTISVTGVVGKMLDYSMCQTHVLCDCWPAIMFYKFSNRCIRNNNHTFFNITIIGYIIHRYFWQILLLRPQSIQSIYSGVVILLKSLTPCHREDSMLVRDAIEKKYKKRYFKILADYFIRNFL